MAFFPTSLRIVPVLLVLVSCLPAQGGLGGGGPLDAVPFGHDCVTPAERAAADAQVLWYLQNHGLLETGPGLLRFYPMGGQLAQDLSVNNYVDLNSGSGVLDWHCTDYTYNGHLGSDTDIRTFDEQLIGIPIFAAQDGAVIATQDGNSDMNTTWAGQPANYVIIDHGGGRVAYYWHMKNGSVAVSSGQTVHAGQQIGLTGSSGNSTYPHLHFEVRESGTVVEPWAGPCRAGASLWQSQPAFSSTMYLREFAISRTSPGATSPPFSMPRDPQWVTSDPLIYFWVLANNLPASSTWRVRFYMPTGALAYDSGNVGFGTTSFFRSSWWWWNWNIPAMHNNSNTGTWTLLLDFNGVNMITAPFEVVTAVTPGFNRPPEPVTVSLSPAAPAPGDPISCGVAGNLLLEDLDWDIVRYGYFWTVNGSVVRSVTSAGRSDILPHDLVSSGDVVTCTVTTSDGVASGPTVAATTAVIGPYGLSLYQDAALNAFIDVHNGPASQPILNFFSLDPLNTSSPGTGWAGGLHISVTDFLAQFDQGILGIPPFGGTLNGIGQWNVAYPAALLAGSAGLTFHGISAHVTPGGPVVTPAASHTIQ